jgi:hypothetical protein
MSNPVVNLGHKLVAFLVVGIGVVVPIARIPNV